MAHLGEILNSASVLNGYLEECMSDAVSASERACNASAGLLRDPMADRKQGVTFSKQRVLVADDTRAIREALEIALDLSGYDVATAAAGDTGLVTFKTFRPELALLDVEMPGISGIQLCRLIRKSSNIPVIMLSGIDSHEVKLQALEAGADDYVVKGTDVDELLARVAGQLRWRRLPAERVDGSVEIHVDHTQSDVKTTDASGELPGTASILVAEGTAYESTRGAARMLRTAQRTALAEILKEAGYTVFEATGGARALIDAIKRVPDLIIADSGLTQRDGLNLLKALRGDQATRRIPVIVVRDRATPDDKDSALALGVRDFILRPFTKADLLMRVDWVIAAQGRFARSQIKRRSQNRAA